MGKDKKSKAEVNFDRIETAKDEIYAGKPSRLVFATLLKTYIGLSLTEAKKITKEAKREISHQVLDDRLSMLATEFAGLQELQMNLIDKIDRDETEPIDDGEGSGFSKPFKKDTTRLYALRKDTIMDKVKIINMMSDIKEKQIKGGNAITGYSITIAGSKSPLLKETADLFAKENDSK